MKRTMKLILVVTMMLSMVMPLNSNALTITDCSVGNKCFVYKKGERINFYRSKLEAENNPTINSGQATVAIEDPGAGSRYVKVFVLNTFSYNSLYADSNSDTKPGDAYLEQITSTISSYQDKPENDEYKWESTKWTEDSTKSGEVVVEMPTKEDFISVFNGISTKDGKYTLDVSKFTDELVGQMYVGGYKHLYTGSYDKAKNKIWVVDVDIEIDETTAKLKSAELKEVDLPTTNLSEYGTLPVVYFDKTFDCHDRYDEDEYSCYECGEDYIWTKVGSQAETCKLIPNITSKTKCVKTVKTGAEDYLFEFFGIALVCGVALVIAKKNELFKRI